MRQCDDDSTTVRCRECDNTIVQWRHGDSVIALSPSHCCHRTVTLSYCRHRIIAIALSYCRHCIIALSPSHCHTVVVALSHCRLLPKGGPKLLTNKLTFLNMGWRQINSAIALSSLHYRIVVIALSHCRHHTVVLSSSHCCPLNQKV
jgi:hypothetical protein